MTVMIINKRPLNFSLVTFTQIKLEGNLWCARVGILTYFVTSFTPTQPPPSPACATSLISVNQYFDQVYH